MRRRGTTTLNPVGVHVTKLVPFTCLPAEESEPRASCGDQTQQQGQEATREQAKEAEAKGRPKETERRRAALAHGDEVSQQSRLALN